MKLKHFITAGALLATTLTWSVADDSMRPIPKARKETALRLEKPIERLLFRDHETSVDLFGSYTDTMTRGRLKDGFGGGIGSQHFFTKFIGLGLDAYAWNGDRPRDDITAAVNGSVILRYPIEALRLAPYLFGGAGGIFTKSAGPQIGEHVGLGAEYRFTKNWGVFADARYEFVDKDNDYILPRVGVRFAF